MIKKVILRSALVVFILMNGVAFMHGWRFTHFIDEPIEKTKSPDELSTGQKIATLITGVSNPKSRISKRPATYTTFTLQSNKQLVGWEVKTDSVPAKGTVIFCHGYGGCKSSMVTRADEFTQLGYNAVLFDFMGSGESEGVQCTLGVFEAEEVRDVFNYVSQKGEKKIYLFGSSMGATAIMRAMSTWSMSTSGVILEFPFGTLYHTVCNRFNNMGVPVVPMAAILTFWGGLQNGFWAFSHNPNNYAENMTAPLLLFYGKLDKTVTTEETNEIYERYKGPKVVQVFDKAGHETFLNTEYAAVWRDRVKEFMKAY